MMGDFTLPMIATATSAAKDGLSRAIDLLILATAATDGAGALLIAQACLMQVGPKNASAALEDGRGAVFHALKETIELQTIVSAFERDYPGEDGWHQAHNAIADAFGAEWAAATLAWSLQIADAGAKAGLNPDPGAETLVRWALSLPVMGWLMPALDALLPYKNTDGSGEGARGAAEIVRENVIAAIERGVRVDWLQSTLEVWTRTTGGPAIRFGHSEDQAPAPAPH